MKPLTTSTSSFPALIEGGYLYVDKTAGIYRLVREYKGQYFLSRPRRFGKSLLVSTLQAIFDGRRELFEGLAIASTDYDWQPRPVINLNLGSSASDTPEELEGNLMRLVQKAARRAGCEVDAEYAYQAFQDLIEAVAERDGKVAILVDEYDKPLLDHLGKPGAVAIQKKLKKFYGVVKTTEEHQSFVLITGVSKFTRVSVFSDLNNLTELTMRADYATLLGYTQDELEANFADQVDRLAAHQGIGREEALANLRDWYNGYRFHHAAETVYNPVSLMKCLQEMDLRNYWFETGTPTFLIEQLRRRPVDMTDLTAAETAFSAYDPANLASLPLLVQTGYLTIEGAPPTGRLRRFRLAYPNYEIEESFNMWLAAGFCATPHEDVDTGLDQMLAALERDDVDAMLERLKVFFANVPYDITLAHEKYYRTIFFVVFRLLGTTVEAEVRTNMGRVDAVLKTSAHIYLFEFKLHDTAESALEQMHARSYYERYLADGRPITLVGAAFAAESRDLCDWLVGRLAERDE